MNKFVFSIVTLLLIGACVLPQIPTQITNPVADTAGTAETILKTAVVQTLTAQPTQTPLLATGTSTPTSVLPEAAASPTAPPPSEQAATPTTAAPAIGDVSSPVPTGTFDIPTATDIPATRIAGPVTATQTPGVLTYGTLPPAVPFSYVTLINRARTQAYISLQVVTAEGGPTIIEYPVDGQVEVKAPTGHYLYVAWVGGRKMVGEFRLHLNEDLTITLYRDRVEIKE
jgi:hypothetical protein